MDCYNDVNYVKNGDFQGFFADLEAYLVKSGELSGFTRQSYIDLTERRFDFSTKLKAGIDSVCAAHEFELSANLMRIGNLCPSRVYESGDYPVFLTDYLVNMSKLEATGYMASTIIVDMINSFPESEFEHSYYRAPVLLYILCDPVESEPVSFFKDE